MSWSGDSSQPQENSDFVGSQSKLLENIEQLSTQSQNFQIKVEDEGPKYYTYNPYEGLNTLLEGRASEGFKIPETTEFIFQEESSIKKRSWSENLTFYTGCGALGGAILGGAIGGYQAFKKGQTSQIKNETTRLLANRYINHITTEGRSMGNGLGVLGLFFAGFESYFYNQWSKLDIPYVPDATATVGAGFAAGALYRSAQGVRTSLVAGGMGAAAAGVILGLRTWRSS